MKFWHYYVAFCANFTYLNLIQKKPDAIKQLEKRLNAKFTKVEKDQIFENANEKRTVYATDENENIIGLCIEKFGLKNIMLPPLPSNKFIVS